MIEAQAPGKVVLWGEYAVLLGAPALVMAVNRRAVCHLTPGGEAWGFSAAGFSAPDTTLSRERLLKAIPPAPTEVASIPWHVLHALDASKLTAGGRVHIDSRAFYQSENKLGLGSSAAVSVAVYAAFCELLDQTPDYRTALHIHHSLQGRLGSGIDVAAAFFGGLLRFQRDAAPSPGNPHRARLPENLHMAFIWTGHSSATTDHVRRFEQWLQDVDNSEPVESLARSSSDLFETEDLMTGLRDYVSNLKALDAAAELGIYHPSHATLDRVAIECGVVYKPCGAGGGDVGAAFSEDPVTLRTFTDRAARNGFTPIALEIASNGVEISR